MRRTLHVASLALATGLLATGAAAQDPQNAATRARSALDRLSIGGAYLGLFGLLHQDERTPSDPVRRGFDFAVNLDVEVELSGRVRAVAQLQSGPGGGEIGFQGPEISVTDINIVVAFPLAGSDGMRSAELVLGSFDTPFGEQTAAQTNNADVTANPVLLNSLLYSVLGGTVGTLNTLGIMGTLATPFADFTAALTNGTDESAANPDGNLELVLSSGTDFGGSSLRAVGSLLLSDDRDTSGSAGLAADLTGFLGELRFEPSDDLRLKGYVGRLSFGDDDAATEDGVIAWMGEVRFGRDRWHLAGRLSGWVPEDRDGSRTGFSAALPNPGLAVDRLGFSPDLDQAIRRLQIGGGLRLGYGLSFRVEFLVDDYRQQTAGRSTDVTGLIFALAGSF